MKFKKGDMVIVKNNMSREASIRGVQEYENMIGETCKIDEVGKYSCYKLSKGQGFWFPECMLERAIRCDIEKYKEV